MKRRPRRLIVIAALSLLLVFACWFFSLTRPGIGTRWKQEPAPPEQISLLTLGPNVEILAQTPEREFYEFFPGSNSPWRIIPEPTKDPEDYGVCNPGDADEYLILPPPGRIISRVSQYCVATESGYEVEMVLLENGEVWSWRYESNGYLSLLLVVSLVLAFMLSISLLLLGLSSAVYQKVRKIGTSKGVEP